MVAERDGLEYKCSDLGVVVGFDLPQELVRLLEVHHSVIGIVEIDLQLS